MKKNSGITMVALVITIVVLLVLAGVSMGVLRGNNGITYKAKESQIMTSLQEMQTAIEQYKIKGEGQRIKAGDFSGEMSNEDLVTQGILQQVTITEKSRTVGIIKDFKPLNISTKIGQKGKEVTVISSAKIEDFKDVFAIDFTDNTLYYINEKVWSLSGKNDLASGV